MLLRRAVLLAALLALPTRAAEQPLRAFDQVEVAPARTSIYVGSVALTCAKLTRTQGVFSTSYAANVFPYFFYSEKGTLSIDFTDEMLRRLECGEAVEFKGRAVRTDGDERRVKGKATPANAASGQVKVRVFYSKRIELIFNTTYRFSGVDSSARGD